MPFLLRLSIAEEANLLSDIGQFQHTDEYFDF